MQTDLHSEFFELFAGCFGKFLKMSKVKPFDISGKGTLLILFRLMCESRPSSDKSEQI